MPWKPLCDFANPEDGTPCLDDAPIECSVSFEGRTYRALLCKTHGQALVNAGEPASLPKVTKLPAAGPPKTRKASESLIEKIDLPDARAWLEAQGDLPGGSRGRIKKELQEKWISAGEPRPK